MSEKNMIYFTADDGSQEAFFVLEKADLSGNSYLLVADTLEEEAMALILKEVKDEDTIVYEVVSDDEELKIVSKYFEELLEDTAIE